MRHEIALACVTMAIMNTVDWFDGFARAFRPLFSQFFLCSRSRVRILLEGVGFRREPKPELDNIHLSGISPVSTFHGTVLLVLWAINIRRQRHFLLHCTT